MNAIGILSFEPKYFERIWGGRNLESLYRLPLPEGSRIGEAWLVSDHEQHQSVVDEGPHAGRTLHDLLVESPESLLGSLPKPTPRGRFPLILKLLDAAEWLSVQVHPNDKDARRLAENDAGKTEMWHVLHAAKNSELICGVKPGIRRTELQSAVTENRAPSLLERFAASEDDSVFVPAGTIHAIGPGIVLAEIQQNSDVTYRIYDWGRLGVDGQPRELHVEKALDVADLGASRRGPQRPLSIDAASHRRTVLAACDYFAAESVELSGEMTCEVGTRSFHIVLTKAGAIRINDGRNERELAPGRAALIPAACRRFTVSGAGSVLDYYVPDLERDVLEPLVRAGHSRDAVRALVPQLS